MISIFKKIYNKLLIIALGVYKILEIKVHKNGICIFNTPIHGNIGDHAIYVAENKMLSELYPKKRIISIPTNIIERFAKIIHSNIKNQETIYITGGGFLGNLWMCEEDMVRKIIKIFSDKRIIIFPSTVFFTDDEYGRKELENSKIIYESHENLHLFLREKYSYNFVKNNFNLKNIYLVPDMVLYLKRFEHNNNNNTISICLRSDKEKIEDYSETINKILKKYDFNINNTSTIINNNIIGFNKSKNCVYNKIKEFSNSKMIITDRLHGMVFAYLAKTPCIVVESKSYKLKGVYEWIKSCNFIVFSNKSKIEENIDTLLSLKDSDIKIVELNDKFQRIKKLIESE